MSTKRSIWRWLGYVAFWGVLGLEVLTMGQAGLSKFQNLDGWLYWFAQFGYPPQLSLVIGAVELVGAGLLLIPRMAAYVGIVLTGVMLGALEAVLTTETDLGWFDPVLHMVFLAVIIAVRWGRRWRPGMAREPSASAVR